MKISLFKSDYFNHPHNNTIQNERAVELPLAFRYLNEEVDDVVEIGAVTPYYKKPCHAVYDPIDPKATRKEFSQNIKYENKNVLSISTIEHFGLNDYHLRTIRRLAITELERIYAECNSCLISFAIGYNKDLDQFVSDHKEKFEHFFYVCVEKNTPLWVLTRDESCFNIQYDKNSAIFICKNLMVSV